MDTTANNLTQQTLNQLPTRKDEAWRFTSLTDFKDYNWQLPKTEESTTLSHDQLKEIASYLPSEFHNFVFVDGTLNLTLSDELEDVLLLKSSQVEIDFKSDDLHTDKALIELAKARAKQTIHFNLKQNQQVEKPVHILFVQTQKDPTYISHNIQLKLAKNSEATFLTQTISLSTAEINASNIFLQADADQDSRLKLVQLQNENEKSYGFSQTEINTESNSLVQYLVVSLGGKLVRNHFQLKFNGEQANGEVFGVIANGNQQHTDNYTIINHIKGANQSIQTYKSILADQAHSVFRGIVRIEPDAQKANSEQLNNNLLLGAKAQADSIPQLDIYADDVKAAHGSTVGQLNPDEIFYLRSRAIDKTTAVRMLAVGYAQELIYKFSNPDLVNWLLKSLGKKLERTIQDV